MSSSINTVFNSIIVVTKAQAGENEIDDQSNDNFSLDGTTTIVPIETLMNPPTPMFHDNDSSRATSVSEGRRKQNVKSEKVSSPNANNAKSSKKRNSTSSMEEIKMPEVHQAIANSSIPIPLNTLIKGWNNVPKLHQYQPSDLQVLYHRRSGDVEAVISNNKSTTLKSSEDNDVVPLNAQSISPNFIVGLSNNAIKDSPGSSRYGLARQKEKDHVNKIDIDDKLVRTDDQLENLIQQKPAIFSSCSKYVQTVNYPKTSSGNQTQADQSTIACQTPRPWFQPFKEDQDLTSCGIQTSVIQSVSNNSSSQTETEDVDSQSEFSQTEATNVHTTDTQITVSTNDATCQTSSNDELISKPTCGICPLVQIQAHNLEQKMEVLSELLISTEQDLLIAKEQLLLHRAPEKSDSQQQTEDDKWQELKDKVSKLEKLQLKKEEDIRYYETIVEKFERENNQLKGKIVKLRLQVDSFQNGMSRLRTAIEKPVGDSNLFAGETIDEVLRKADEVISNYSVTQQRVEKIGSYISVLNDTVTDISRISVDQELEN